MKSAKINKAEMIFLRPKRPGELIAFDVAGKLPKTKNGNEYILVVVDHFTKWTRYYAMKTATSKETAKCLVEYMLIHGIPERFLSDQGANYQSFLIEEIHDLLDIHKLRTSPYHPQTDGVSEKSIDTAKVMITQFANENKDN